MLFFLCCLAFSTSVFAQDDKDNKEENEAPEQLAPIPPPANEIFYQGSLYGGGGIIYPVTNHALGMSLQGVYYLHVSPQYVVAPHLFVGLELENNQLGITGTISAYNVNMFTYAAGAKIGYYSYMQRDFFLSAFVSGGMSYIKFSNVPIAAPKGGFYKEAPFFTPGFFVGYRVNDELRIGLELSYIFNLYQFDPNFIGLENYRQYSASDIKGITTCFAWGFGVYCAFFEKKTLPTPKEQ